MTNRLRTLPYAAQKIVPYADEAGPFTADPLGWVLHVTQSNGSPFGAFAGAVSPNRRFSNLWVGKDGSVEQYTHPGMKPWAQAAGNGQYVAVETEGFTTEPLTDAQIGSLAKIHNDLGAPDTLAEAPGQPGVGTHVMGGVAWGNHSCPGPVRAGQRQAIIDKAKSLRPVAPPKPPASDIPPVFTKPPVATPPVTHPPLPKVPSFPGTTQRGSKGAAVYAVQGRLAARGWHLAVDGDFGRGTDTVVRAFQAEKKLTVDGIVGPATWAALWTAPVTK